MNWPHELVAIFVVVPQFKTCKIIQDLQCNLRLAKQFKTCKAFQDFPFFG